METIAIIIGFIYLVVRVLWFIEDKKEERLTKTMGLGKHR